MVGNTMAATRQTIHGQRTRNKIISNKMQGGDTITITGRIRIHSVAVIIKVEIIKILALGEKLQVNI